MNKKIIKKVVSILLALTIIFPNITFADLQGPVLDLGVTNRSSTAGTDYSVELNWTRPYQSGSPDTTAYGSDASTSHRATSYSVYYRNGTKGEAYNESKRAIIDDAANVSKTDVTIDRTMSYLFQPSYLDSGSVYSFYVNPTHTHLYEKSVNGVLSYITDNAKKTNVNSNEVLFLTDIQVQAQITGNEMTVTWDNPTYMGAEIFTGYKIYYQKGGAGISKIPDNPSVVVSSSDSSLKRSGTKMQYTFKADNLEVGQLYAVKVEPMYNGSVLREMTKPLIVHKGVAYNVAFTTREYRTNDAYVNPALYIMQEGLDFVRLYWDNLNSSSFNITKLELYSSKSENFDQSILIGSLEGYSAQSINYWLAQMPETLTFYKFVLYYKDGSKINTMESNIVYFDPTIFDFNPYMPNIMDVEINSSTSTPMINITWEAFLRDAYTQAEEASKNNAVNKYVDKQLDYKIWITDDVSNFSIPAFDENYVKLIDANGLSEKEYVLDKVTGEKTLVYGDSFGTYYSYNLGTATQKSFEENKIYYIKIQAQRHLSGDLSQPAYYAIYIPPSTSIVTNPLSINKPPFKVKINEQGVEEVTEKTITVEWSTQWFEIYDETTKEWYSSIGVENGKIILGDKVESLSSDKVLLLDSEFLFGSNLNNSVNNIKDALIAMGASQTDVNLLPIRLMDISESKYELHTTPYINMEQNGGYESYFNLIEVDDALWTGVSGTKNGPRKLQYTVTNTNAPTTSALEQNTSYVIYFRNYIIKNGEKIYSQNPIYAVATTLKDRDDLQVTPPAQIIEFVNSSYDSVTVRWLYSSEMKYELRYSNKVTDYSKGGVPVTHAIIEENMQLVTDDGETYIYYKIPNLFPTTTYYAWLKASTSFASSDWSTAVSGRTTELKPPTKPKGVGIISDDFLQIINVENSKNYSKDDPTSLILEWTRIVEDKADYGVKGITTVNSDEYFGTAAILESYGVKFNNLKANTNYYFRVRTVLNAKRNGMGGNYYYSYEVELADNPRFKDSIKFYVPNHGLAVDNLDVLQVVSEWSTVYKFETGKSYDEYDGEIDESQYPMPLDDFDITYDEENDILRYEFRSTGTDSQGNKNHYVDQRFITSLQQKGYFDFVVDVTDYQGIYPKTRIVEVPSSVIRALQDTKTSLTMVSDNMEVTIAHDTFASESAFLDDSGKVEFEFNLNRNSAYMIGSNESILSTPYTFSATVSTDTTRKVVQLFNNNVKVRLRPENQYAEIDNNVNMYKLNNENWQVQTSTKLNNGKYETSTKTPGTYSLIARSVPISTTETVDDSLYNVNTEIIISDLDYYVPQYDVTTTQFNNIIYAIAMDQSTVAMNESITQQKYNHLGKAGLLVSGSYVTNESGIQSLIRLYELKTGSRITPTTDTVPNIGTAGTDYQTSIKKAYEIEMYDYISNFKANMTFGEFIYYIDVILSDS